MFTAPDLFAHRAGEEAAARAALWDRVERWFGGLEGWLAGTPFEVRGDIELSAAAPEAGAWMAAARVGVRGGDAAAVVTWSATPVDMSGDLTVPVCRVDVTLVDATPPPAEQAAEMLGYVFDYARGTMVGGGWNPCGFRMAFSTRGADGR